MTDATLTEEGVPAEAKAVGAKLAEQSTSLLTLKEQLGNHTVKSDVPENAMFTDTIYDDTEVKESIAELNSNLSVIGKCKNLLNPTLQTITSAGVTCTNNGDGTYTLNGTVTDNSGFIIQDIIYKAGVTYKLVGCPVGGSNSTYRLSSDWGASPNDYGSGTNIKYSAEHITKIGIYFSKGTTFNNLVFKPMLTTNLNATYDDFVPYTGDGETLASDVAEIKNDLDALEYSEVAGGKNLLPQDYKNRIINGVTFTVNDDKSITVNGTATATTDVYIKGGWASTDVIIKATKPLMINKKGWTNDVYMYAINNTSIINDSTGRITRDVTCVILRVNSGVTIDNVTVYPMIYYADIEDDTYEAYISSVKMLTRDVAELKNLSASNAGAHNSVYCGKYLGNALTAEQKAQISAGTFNDLYIGDYWKIGGVNYRIAAFDYWLNSGDTNCTTHHVVIVPDTCLYNARMNTTNTTTGAYIGSEMYKTNLAQAKTTIENAFGSANILSHREYLANATKSTTDPTYESAGSWYDSTVEIMNERMVYGADVFHNIEVNGAIPTNYTIDKSQLPLFALEPSRICNRAYWWLRDVMSAAHFAFVSSYGNANYSDASNSFGVRPAFAIKG